MNNEEASLIKTAILDAVQTYMDAYKDKLNFVKTETAIVRSSGTNRGNKIEIKGKIYDNIMALSNVTYDKNNIVFVLIPNGQYSNMFILGKLDDSPSNVVGGTINIGNGSFKVDDNGNVTIKKGVINIGSGNFVVNSDGGVTSKSLTVAGGSINIGNNNFVVTNNGSVTAKSLTVNGGSINLGNGNFTVDSSGNATMKNLTVTGGSFDITTLSGRQDVYTTSYTTQGINYSSGLSPQGGIRSTVQKGTHYLKSYWGDTGGFQIYSDQGGGNAMISFLAEPSILEGQGESGTFETSSSVSSVFGGTVYNSSGGVVFVSDRDKKHDIEYLNNNEVADFIYKLKPCEFRFNENTSNRLHHGLIAQDVKESMGDEDWGLYIEKSNGEKGLRYDELISDLVATVQSQNDRIKELESIIRGNNTPTTSILGSNSDENVSDEEFVTENTESLNEANMSDINDIKNNE